MGVRAGLGAQGLKPFRVLGFLGLGVRVVMVRVHDFGV